MKKILAVVVLLIVLAPMAYVAWEKEWFVTTPGAVFKDSLAKANAGRYEEATNNVFMLDRGGLLKDPVLMKDVWDKVTKNRTIQSVETTNDGREMKSLRGCSFVITYQDGSKFSGSVPGAYDGGWQHGIKSLWEKILDDEFASLTIPLSEAYSRIENSKIEIRLPIGAAWNAKAKGFEVPKTGVTIDTIDTPPEISFSGLEKWAKHQLSKPEYGTTEHRELSQNETKAVLIEAGVKGDKGPRRHMYLVIGNKINAPALFASTPKQENLIKMLRECLTSARIEGDNK